MKITRLGAVDIGSNSVRLLISNVLTEGKKEVLFKKSSLTRLPIRLGADVFTAGKISPYNTRRLVAGMHAFKNIAFVNEVKRYRACATSAMREAENGREVLEKVRKETGIEVEVIDGAEEARLIFSTKLLRPVKSKHQSFLYIDVGGGSTELTLFEDEEMVSSGSFNIGTIRILNGRDSEEEWTRMRSWIRENASGREDLAMVASGGNINRLFKLSGKGKGVPLTLDYLEEQYEFLQRFTRDELVKRFDLNIDRADVIVPACSIYLSAMEWAGAQKMFVPKVGLSDGIVRDLYGEN